MMEFSKGLTEDDIEFVEAFCNEYHDNESAASFLNRETPRLIEEIRFQKGKCEKLEGEILDLENELSEVRAKLMAYEQGCDLDEDASFDPALWFEDGLELEDYACLEDEDDVPF